MYVGTLLFGKQIHARPNTAPVVHKWLYTTMLIKMRINIKHPCNWGHPEKKNSVDGRSQKLLTEYRHEYAVVGEGDGVGEGEGGWRRERGGVEEGGHSTSKCG